MSKKLVIGAVAAVALIAVLAVGIYATAWDMPYDSPQAVDYDPVVDDKGAIDHDSLNYIIFEQYGPLLMVLAILMFGAILGGICVAREEIERVEGKKDDKEAKE